MQMVLSLVFLFARESGHGTDLHTPSTILAAKPPQQGFGIKTFKAFFSSFIADTLKLCFNPMSVEKDLQHGLSKLKFNFV